MPGAGRVRGDSGLLKRGPAVFLYLEQYARRALRSPRWRRCSHRRSRTGCRVSSRHAVGPATLVFDHLIARVSARSSSGCRTCFTFSHELRVVMNPSCHEFHASTASSGRSRVLRSRSWKRGRVLLSVPTLAKFAGWELPGGQCEPGEDPAFTAARETEEEMGYKVRIAGIVGVYFMAWTPLGGVTSSSLERSSAVLRDAASRRGPCGWRTRRGCENGVSLGSRASARCGGRCRRRRGRTSRATGDHSPRARVR